jgi:integrase
MARFKTEIIGISWFLEQNGVSELSDNELVEIIEKIKVVNAYHKYAISYHSKVLPNDHYKQPYYYTRLPSSKERKYRRMKSYSVITLIERLYNYYVHQYKNEDSYSFKEVFELALDEKVRTENPKEKTIDDYRFSFDRFIDENFANIDITQITPSMVKEYLQKITQEIKPTKKSFYKFKGVLNLVFNYAADPEHGLIKTNPVPKNNRPYVKNCVEHSSRPEDKAFQPHEIELIKQHLWKRINELKYDVNGYAILFSIETGVREGEIPSLKWADISPDRIHIHSQQNDVIKDGKKIFYYNPTTKNEKGLSKDGRYIPLTQNTGKILRHLKTKQTALGINSEWVFAKENGDWITTASYAEALYYLCKGNSSRGTTGLNLKLSNNHAFRMALNSYVFIPMGLTVTERAMLLGHSVQTNIQFYSFSKSADYNDEILKTWNRFNENNNLSIENFRKDHEC